MSKKKAIEPPQPPAPARWAKFETTYPDIWQAALELLERHQCVHATRLWEIAPVDRFNQHDIGQLANELVTFGPAHWGRHMPTFSQAAFATLGPSARIDPSVAPEQWHISVEK